ncbi:UNVERIFIED_CONTAM: hypothetical protein GTU68_014355 [Idotea baltica]|nr:hypothetical protein [Idotea baltica]
MFTTGGEEGLVDLWWKHRWSWVTKLQPPSSRAGKMSHTSFQVFLL